MIDENGKDIGYRGVFEKDLQIRSRLLQFNPVSTPTIMARKDLVRKCGGYRDGEIAEDYGLLVRLAKISKFHGMQKPLVRYRIYSSNRTTRYALSLFLDSLRIKQLAMSELGLVPSFIDLIANVLQFFILLIGFFDRITSEKLKTFLAGLAHR